MHGARLLPPQGLLPAAHEQAAALGGLAWHALGLTAALLLSDSALQVRGAFWPGQGTCGAAGRHVHGIPLCRGWPAAQTLVSTPLPAAVAGRPRRQRQLSVRHEPAVGRHAGRPPAAPVARRRQGRSGDGAARGGQPQSRGTLGGRQRPGTARRCRPQHLRQPRRAPTSPGRGPVQGR